MFGSLEKDHFQGSYPAVDPSCVWVQGLPGIGVTPTPKVNTRIGAVFMELKGQKRGQGFEPLTPCMAIPPAGLHPMLSPMLNGLALQCYDTANGPTFRTEQNNRI